MSKLWLTNDENGFYRGVYQWDGSARAIAYVRSLWWVLSLVSVRGSIHYIVLPGMWRDIVLQDPRVLDDVISDRSAWWRLTQVEPASPSIAP